MKRTEWKVCCGKENLIDVYRRVLTNGSRYFVKWHGKIIDVTEDKASFHYYTMVH